MFCTRKRRRLANAKFQYFSALKAINVNACVGFVIHFEGPEAGDSYQHISSFGRSTVVDVFFAVLIANNELSPKHYFTKKSEI